MQNHYNLVYREEEREMIPLCRAEGVGLIPYSPLARGFLAASRSREQWETTLRARTDGLASPDNFRDSDWEVLERVKDIAAKRGVPAAQIALAWVMSQPGVTAPIVGASSLAQLDDAIAATALELDPAECAQLEQSYHPRSGKGYL
jgi:aryl-alcohol dehydrogenase (NADP+)